MIKVRRIALSKMQFLEVNSFVKDVVLVVEKHNPKALRLGDMYELLLEQRSYTAFLNSPYGRHPITLEYNRLHELRLSYVAFISKQIRAIVIGKFDNTQHLVEVAYPVVKNYLFYMRQNNRQVIS